MFELLGKFFAIFFASLLRFELELVELHNGWGAFSFKWLLLKDLFVEFSCLELLGALLQFLVNSGLREGFKGFLLIKAKFELVELSSAGHLFNLRKA